MRITQQNDVWWRCLHQLCWCRLWPRQSLCLLLLPILTLRLELQGITGETGIGRIIKNITCLIKKKFKGINFLDNRYNLFENKNIIRSSSSNSLTHLLKEVKETRIEMNEIERKQCKKKKILIFIVFEERSLKPFLLYPEDKTFFPLNWYERVSKFFFSFTLSTKI